MIVQEAGIAVGWPLGLGHDTTGWPLGLRLRLTQEDLQWPKEPGLARTLSYTSEDSSSLDTMSTRSFFQDKSISLGALIGLPLMEYNPNRQHRQRAGAGGGVLSTIASSPASPVGTPPRAATPASTSPPQRRRNLNGSPGDPSLKTGCRKTASSAGWNLLSVLSCARVPAEVGIPMSQSLDDIERVKSTLDGGYGQEEETESVVDAEEEESGSEVVERCSQLSASGKKLYDNITFEDEVEDNSHDDDGFVHHGSQSFKEWNPMFASSSMMDYDEENETSEVVDTSPPRILRQETPVRSSPGLSDALSHVCTRRKRGSDSVLDVRKQEPREKRREGHQMSFSPNHKSKAVSMFVSRMVCCLSTPTTTGNNNNC